MYKISLIALITVLMASNQSLLKAQSPTGTITIKIGTLRNMNGHLLISLFNKDDAYPDNADAAFRTKKIKVSKERETVVLNNIPYGEYALVFLHDENDSQEMDTNMMGIPKEGYGASNNAVNTFSAPKYSEAKFRLNSANTTQSLKVYY